MFKRLAGARCLTQSSIKQRSGSRERVRFVQGWVGELASSSHEAVAESIGKPIKLKCSNMAAIADLAEGQIIEVLRIDAQGAELGYLRSMSGAAVRGRCILSSSPPITHQLADRLQLTRTAWLKFVGQGGAILCDHAVEESFSGDGLIIATFYPEDRNMILPNMSRNKAETSLFGTS